MNIQEIYELGLEQGWDEADAFYLATIAWAESKGVANEITDEPDGTKSFGIWQINSVHLPKLVEAGILHQPDTGEGFEANLNLLMGQLADPATNARAAEYVGHRRDYSEPSDDWDFTRWSVHSMPINDGNHPGNYGGDIERTFAAAEDESPEIQVPVEFSGRVIGTEEWKDWVDENGWDSAEQDLALGYLYGQYVEGGYDNIETWLMEGKDIRAYKALDDFFVSKTPEPYVPSSMGQLPEGWLSFWGDDTVETDPAISQWFQKWVQVFEDNREEEVTKYLWTDLKADFLADLDKQGWWNTKRTSYTDLARLWYSGGGPGGALSVDGDWVQGAGLALPLPDPDSTQAMSGRNYEGTGDWKHIWTQTKEVIASVLGDLDDRLENATGLSSHINNIAWMLMREGQASEFYNPTDAWSGTATSLIERYAEEHLYDEEGNLLPSVSFVNEDGTPIGTGAGSVQDNIDALRARANSQLYDYDENILRQWALEIKTERGPSLAQRMAQIDAEAYSSWGLSTDQIDGMGKWSEEGSPGGNVASLVNPLWSAATTFWDDKSYNKNDPWLMDNYQVEEDGVKRFRTAQEMRNLARTNLDRSQHSKEYQNPMNEFLVRAAAMFRSDF